MDGAGYVIDGEVFPRVSAIVGVLRREFLERWRGSVGNDQADRIQADAFALGKMVHKLTEADDLGQPRPAAITNPVALALADRYREWRTHAVGRVVHVERLLVSRRYGFAGTCDRLVILHDQPLDELTLVDLKTGAHDISHGLQLAAYALAAEEEGFRITRRLIVRLDKRRPEAPAEVMAYTDDEGDRDGFLAALRLWRWRVAAEARTWQLAVERAGARPR